MNPLKPSAYLAGLNIDVMRFGLEAITGLLERFGFPQNEYPALLIAGTNGKGQRPRWRFHSEGRRVSGPGSTRRLTWWMSGSGLR